MEFCLRHAAEDMVNVARMKFGHDGCTRGLLSGVAGIREAEL